VWEEGAAAALGVVRDVQPLGGPWLLAVEMAQGGEMLIPMAAEICTTIDIAARRISVRLPEGLRKLNS
jgi:ribosomal 30S subunit maturation factor RimM